MSHGEFMLGRDPGTGSQEVHACVCYTKEKSGLVARNLMLHTCIYTHMCTHAHMHTRSHWGREILQYKRKNGLTM